MLRPGADPRGALAEVVNMVEAADPADDNALGMIGAGPLESLLIHHEDDLWDEVEQIARSNPRFLRALRSVWNYPSPRFEQRQQLLVELNEWRQVDLSLVAYDQSFDGSGWTYRALKHDSSLSARDLACVLREVAADLEDPPQETYKSPPRSKPLRRPRKPRA
jgi:hypothetical protein